MPDGRVRLSTVVSQSIESDAGATSVGNVVSVGSVVVRVADLVAQSAARGPDHPALVEPAAGVRLSWAQVHAATEAEALRLRGAGVRPGDRVLLRLGQCAGFCIALLGALRADAIAVPVGIRGARRVRMS